MDIDMDVKRDVDMDTDDGDIDIDMDIDRDIDMDIDRDVDIDIVGAQIMRLLGAWGLLGWRSLLYRGLPINPMIKVAEMETDRDVDIE